MAITQNHILIIGAASRNVGKTEFACRVISRRASGGPVIGVKITASDDRHAGCARGGTGCGACSSLDGDFEITEETDRGGSKDTARMLAAGATRVYWLRVRRAQVAAGIAALLERLPPDLPVVCESNAARTVIDPGVFLVIRPSQAGPEKPSCAAVAPLADRIVTFDGRDWDFSPAHVLWAQSRWLLRQDATAIILAGGQSRRMGQDKSLMPIGDVPMIQHIANQLQPFFAELLVGANSPGKYDFLGLPVVPDQAPDMGPLMGIMSGLARSRHDLNFVCGCDIPTMHLDFILQMLRTAENFDIVMPRSPDGRPEPLFALYRRSVIPVAKAVLERGGRRIVDLLPGCRVKHLELPATGWYRNLNTLADYQEALRDINRGPAEP